MSQEAVARRYARAVFEIGQETRTLDTLNREIQDFAAVYSGNAELRDALANPLVAVEARDAVLKDIGVALKLSETAERTIRLLSAKGRIRILPDLARELALLTDEEGSLLRAQVISAGPLSPGYLDKLKAELEKATGKKVAITHEQDPSLIAGVVTRIGDRVIDGSALARLKSFRDAVLSS